MFEAVVCSGTDVLCGILLESVFKIKIFLWLWKFHENAVDWIALHSIGISIFCISTNITWALLLPKIIFIFLSPLGVEAAQHVA